MKKTLVINKDNFKEIELVKEYDKYNNIITTANDETKKTKVSEEEYQKLQRKSNEIEHQIILEHDNKNKEICFISGVRDIKQSTLVFSNKKNPSKKIITEGLDYALNTLGMETVFINVEKDNQKLIKQLEDLEFIDIGEVDGKATYLKEKEEIEIGSMRSGHNKKH